MTTKTIVQAINEALFLAMEQEDIVILGEDVGKNGGVFRVTDGLQEKYGEMRVIDTPLAESGIIGTAVGMSLNGLRPIAEIQFFGFIYEAMDQIVSQATRMRYRSNGRFSAPIVIRSPYGAGVNTPELHADSVEAIFSHSPGMKIVMPSNPYDAKGLLLAAIADPDPVLYLEPMSIYRSIKEEVPDEAYTVALGEANVVTEGSDVTIVAWGPPVVWLQKIVTQYAEKGISIELIDLRTVAPIDIETIVKSVEKTERLCIVHEAVKTNGIGAEIAALVSERAIFSLLGPIKRVAGFDSPYPAGTIEKDWMPNPSRVQTAIEELLTYE
ncbi:alpha-ketoacid dehydrogenase subunit beta [Kurthia massiliensis]|uniref:alpha-ketoacid dehydrogenase subunit beta n=1 Tax=Kurthia massiliensis TaxID=1033739 RepID=UPI000289EF7B|nr:alpha-ketoacid dehydrogenase subunit beta [Kurthia massiliensis]